jgi:hypothetical protein
VLFIAFEGAGRPAARLRTATVAGGIGAIPALLWVLYTSAAGNGSVAPSVSFYVWSRFERGGLHTVLFKAGSALREYAFHAGRLIVFSLPTSLAGVGIACALAMIIAAGFVYRVWRRRTIVEYYVVLYACALLTFPGSRQQRYLVPLLPFVWYYFLTACDLLLTLRDTRGGDRRPRLALVVNAAIACLLVVSLATNVFANAIQGRGRVIYEPAGLDSYRDVLVWIRNETPPDAVVMSPRPSLCYLLGGRRGVNVPGRTFAQIRATLHGRRIDYVVAHPRWKDGQALGRFAERYPAQLTPVHRDTGITVYLVRSVQNWSDSSPRLGKVIPGR